MKVACDIGSGFCKITYSKNKSISFPSLVGEKPTEDAFGIENTRPVEMDNGKSFLVDKDALNYIKPDERSNTLTTEWVGSEGWIAILYSSIDKILKDQITNKEYKGDIEIAIGLPQAVFSRKKKEIKENIESKRHIFKVGENKYDIYFKVLVLPQAFSVMASIKNFNPTIGSVGIIDIGTFTTGFSSLYEGSYNHPESGGINLGMNDFYKLFKEKLKENHGIIVNDEYKIQKILNHKKIIYRKNELSLSPIIKEISIELSERISSSAEELWFGSDDRKIILAGGGSIYFKENMEKIFPGIITPEDSFFSVSRGMYNLLIASS